MKILIEIEGGIVQSIIASEDCEIMVVDLDHAEDKEVDWSYLSVSKPDIISDNIFSEWENSVHYEVYGRLKELNF